MQVTGIILAGGKSSRMGSDKGLIEVDGTPMVGHVIKIISPLCDQLLISTANPEYNQFGIPTITDVFHGIGPISGLYSCLKESHNQLNLCIPCDVPQMKPEILRFLVSQALDYPDNCIVPVTNFPEPLVAVYPISVISSIGELIAAGTNRMTEIFNIFPTRFISMTESGFDQSSFKNVNTLRDL